MYRLIRRTLRYFHGRGRDVMLGARLAPVWPDVAGEVFARYAFPVNIEGKHLTVGVTSAVWMAEARYFEDEFIRKLDEKLGAGVITRVSFCMLASAPGAIHRPSMGGTARAMGDAAAAAEADLSPDQAARLEEELSHIKDETLRHQMRRIFKKALQRERDERGRTPEAS
jgi:hypothetical protein